MGCSAKLGQTLGGVLHSAQRLLYSFVVELRRNIQLRRNTVGAFPYRLLTLKGNSTFPLYC